MAYRRKPYSRYGRKSSYSGSSKGYKPRYSSSYSSSSGGKGYKRKSYKSSSSKQSLPMRTVGWNNPVVYKPGGELKFNDSWVLADVLTINSVAAGSAGCVAPIASPPQVLFEANGTVASPATVVGRLGYTHLTNMIPGSDATNRTGRKITVKSVQWKITVKQVATQAAGHCRVVVFQDRQSNTLAPLISDLFANGVQGYNVVSPINLNNRDRFLIISDSVLPLTELGTTNDVAIFEGYKKGNYDVVFNSGATAVIGSIQTGAIFVATMTSCDFTNGGIGNYNPVTNAFFRLRFMDV